jgi:hypothetical protein
MKQKLKPFFVISALLDDSSPLGKLRRFVKEADAVAHAKDVIGRRAREGRPSITFHVLKVISIVEPVTPPVRVTRLK